MTATGRIITAAALLAAVAASFVAGRLTAPDDKGRVAAAAACEDIRQSSGLAFRNAARELDADPAMAHADARTGANLILQNRDCFSADDRAQAQTVLDQVENHVDQQQLQRLRDDVQDCVDAETDEYSWSTC